MKHLDTWLLKIKWSFLKIKDIIGNVKIKTWKMKSFLSHGYYIKLPSCLIISSTILRFTYESLKIKTTLVFLLLRTQLYCYRGSGWICPYCFCFFRIWNPENWMFLFLIPQHTFTNLSFVLFFNHSILFSSFLLLSTL